MRLVPYKREAVRFDDMFSMMDDFFNNSLTHKEHKQGFRLDILENNNAYIIEGELPGVAKENLEIAYENNLLKISVKASEEKEVEEKNYLHRERRSVAMERTIKFKDINAEAIEAKLEHGLLRVTLPKLEKVENKKRIEIQ